MSSLVHRFVTTSGFLSEKNVSIYNSFYLFISLSLSLYIYIYKYKCVSNDIGAMFEVLNTLWNDHLFNNEKISCKVATSRLIRFRGGLFVPEYYIDIREKEKCFFLFDIVRFRC